MVVLLIEKERIFTLQPMRFQNISKNVNIIVPAKKSSKVQTNKLLINKASCEPSPFIAI